MVSSSTTITPNWETGLKQRHHMSKRTMQRAFDDAIRTAGIHKHTGCHTFRYSFATHLLEEGREVQTVQELLGH